MKKLFCILLSVLTLFSLVACSSAGTEEKADTPQVTESTPETTAPQAQSSLQAGFGRSSIMPNGEVHLAGGDASKRVSTVVLDFLYITCVALKQNDQTVLVYTMDIITADDEVVDPVKVAISGATGVPQENILMNATHTHSSVSIRSNWDGVQDYRNLFSNAAVSAATAAIADLADAEVYHGDAQTEGLAFVRHYELDNGTFAGSNFGDFSSGTVIGHAEKADTLCQIVRFTRADEGKKDIIMMNFPAHATMNGKTTDTMISADFPGTTRQYIEQNTDTLVAYYIAAAGNQVPTTRIKGEAAAEGYKEYGQVLGQYVVDALPNLTKLESTELKLTTKTFTGGSNKEKMELLPKAAEVIAAGKTYGNTSAEAVSAARANGFSSYFEATAVQSRASLPATISMELKTMTIGNLGFIFAPYEMFGTSAMDLREKSPCDATFIVTCGEGAKGYLPDTRGFEIGCYESCVTQFERGTAEKLVDEFVAMLKG